MAYQKRTLEELNVMDDFLFSALASDRYVGAPFCRVLLSALLQRSIGKIRVVAQHAVPGFSPAYRESGWMSKWRSLKIAAAKKKRWLSMYMIWSHICRKEKI